MKLELKYKSTQKRIFINWCVGGRNYGCGCSKWLYRSHTKAYVFRILVSYDSERRFAGHVRQTPRHCSIRWTHPAQLEIT